MLLQSDEGTMRPVDEVPGFHFALSDRNWCDNHYQVFAAKRDFLKVHIYNGQIRENAEVSLRCIVASEF
jgi:hypothetical protein